MRASERGQEGMMKYNFDDVDLAMVCITIIVITSMYALQAHALEIIVGAITAIAALAKGKPNGRNE